jgi:hypothetical protein
MSWDAVGVVVGCCWLSEVLAVDCSVSDVMIVCVSG